MKITPLVSIIVPIYNGDVYLESCIQSVCNQNFKEWELILVNDGSTDETENICLKYARIDERIHYHKQLNSGVSAARNLGIEKACAEWLFFLDADDCIGRFALDILATSPEESNMIICGFTRNEDGYQYASEGMYVQPNKIRQAILNFESVKRERNDWEIIDDFSNWTSCGRFIRRSVVMENGIRFDIEIKYGEDLLFCYRALTFIGNVYLNKSRIYYYRENPQSVTSLFRKDLPSNARLLAEAIEEYTKEILFPYFYRFCVSLLTDCYFRYYVNDHCELDREDAIQQFIDFCKQSYWGVSIDKCSYFHIVQGKRNRIRCIFILFTLRYKLYWILKVFTPLLKRL